jgi:DNA-binding response OmpR family regulator
MNQKLRVLLVEDLETDARIIQEILKDASIECAWCKDLTLAHEIGECDVVLLDLMLPTSLGVETVRKCHAGFPSKPIIVISHVEDVETEAACMQAGADYFFRKGKFNPSDLLRAMDVAVAAFSVRVAMTGETSAIAGYIQPLKDLQKRIDARLLVLVNKKD